MESNPYLEELNRLNAVRTKGHYVLTGGHHSAEYVEKEAYLKHPLTVMRFARGLATQLVLLRCEMDVVLGADGGGTTLAHALALQLSRLLGREILNGYVRTKLLEFESIGQTAGFLRLRSTPLKEYAIRPAYASMLRGARVALVEDVITLGGTMRRLASLVRQHGGDPVAVATPVNRGGLHRLTDIPARVALVPITNTLWDPPNLSFLSDPKDAVGVPCPRCMEEIPINTNLGHGAEFLAKLRSRSPNAQGRRDPYPPKP